MSQAQTAATAHTPEATFKNYDSSQAKAYAQYREAYNPALLSIMISQHTSTGGDLDTLLDVGCGPGIATRQLAGRFTHAYGVDASASMIEEARKDPPLTSAGTPTVYSVCSAEELDQHLPAHSVDLITVATAVHWFDMPKFYSAAAKLLKPSGSIAMWGGGSIFVDPDSTPNAAEVRKIWDDFELKTLDPFMLKGNVICRDLYESLDMPWTIEPTKGSPELAQIFERSRAYKRIFNQDGKPEPDEILQPTQGYLKKTNATFDMARKMMGTASPVTRWREAHKDQLEKGEIEDCLDVLIRETKDALQRGGKGGSTDGVEVGFPFVLVVLKRS